MIKIGIKSNFIKCVIKSLPAHKYGNNMWMLLKSSDRKSLNFFLIFVSSQKRQHTSKLIFRRTVFPHFTTTKDFMLRSLNFGLTVSEERRKTKKLQSARLFYADIDTKSLHWWFYKFRHKHIKSSKYLREGKDLALVIQFGF